MITFLILLLPECIFTFLFIKAGYPASTKKGFFFKMCACAVFLLNGALAYYPDFTSYGRLIMIALIAGFIGDIFLTMDPFLTTEKSKKLSMFFIIIGGAAFLAGHVIYFTALMRRLNGFDREKLTVFAVSLVILLLVCVAVKSALKVSFGKLTAPITVYALAIGSLTALGLTLAVTGKDLSFPARLTGAAAPLLFMISDSSLVLKFFGRERFDTLAVRAVNLGTYFAAQMLFGLSVYLMK